MTIKIRSTTTETVDGRMNIALTGRDGDNAAVDAARVSVTYNGTTTVFAKTGDTTYAVTTNDIPMATVMDSNNNSITSVNFGWDTDTKNEISLGIFK